MSATITADTWPESRGYSPNGNTWLYPAATFRTLAPKPHIAALAFTHGALHERGRTIAADTRRSPAVRERAVMRKAAELLADRTRGAEFAAWLLAGFADGSDDRAAVA